MHKVFQTLAIGIRNSIRAVRTITVTSERQGVEDIHPVTALTPGPGPAIRPAAPRSVPSPEASEA